MTAPTVGHILRELDRRRFQTGLSELADIAHEDRDLVVSALARAPKSAKVDIPCLVTTLRRRLRDSRSDLTSTERRDLAARAANHLARLHAEADRRGIVAGAGRLYALSLELDRAGAGAGAGSRRDDVEPDPELGDDGDGQGGPQTAAGRRRATALCRPTGRSQRAFLEAEQGEGTEPPRRGKVGRRLPRGAAAPATQPKARRPLLRGRGFVDPEDIGGDARLRSLPAAVGNP